MNKINTKFQFSPYQIIVLSYLIAALLGTYLLKMPISVQADAHLSWLDALFTAMSGISVTGLTVLYPAETFTPFGILILMLLIQFGGIGLMTLGTFIWILFGTKINLKERQLIMVDSNRYDLAGLIRVMRFVLSFSLVIELSVAALFGSYLWLFYSYEYWYEAYFHGLFHTLSSFTNAGFDIFGSQSLAPFQQDPFFLTLTMMLIVMGALGFPVLLELTAYLRSQRRRQFHFSLYTKITTLVFFVLMVGGALSLFLLERNHYYQDFHPVTGFFYSLFYSVTARNAGFSIHDVSQFTTPSLYLLSLLMFIGASPSSVGGGIRTTTLFVMLLTITQYARGQREIQIFHRRLAHDDIIKSFIVFTTAVFVLTAMIILVDLNQLGTHSLMQVSFEVASAFGTTGLSMGITAELLPISKVLITITMFIGRIGIVSFLLFFAQRKSRPYRYPTERLIIG